MLHLILWTRCQRQPVYDIEYKKNKRENYKKYNVKCCMLLFFPGPFACDLFMLHIFILKLNRFQLLWQNISPHKLPILHFMFLSDYQNVLTCILKLIWSWNIGNSLKETIVFAIGLQLFKHLFPKLWFLFRVAAIFTLSNTPAYSARAPKTNKTHTIIHTSIAVIPEPNIMKSGKISTQYFFWIK